MTVLYYTSTSFLDIAIEVINILKKDVDLHVLIEITPGSKIGNIININKLPENQSFIKPSALLSKEDYKYLDPYFKGCASISFIVYKEKVGFSSVKLFYKAWYYIKKINPDIILMEELSLRRLILLPFLFFIKKFFIIIHDSKPHSGEKNLKALLPRFLFLSLPFSKKYFFYSEFSKNQFESHYKKDRNQKFVLKMSPYYFYKIYLKKNFAERKHILFFGRFSLYKGIEVLLKAVPLVLEESPSEVFVIAGKSVSGYNFNEAFCDKYKNHISILNRYIPNEELVSLIQKSKFVVCPYLDASQSGVLMTAFALNTPVIATNVGAFPEYIEHNVTGMLVPVNDPNKLSEAIIFALTDNFYKTLADNISVRNSTDLWKHNKTILLNAFSS